MKRILCLCLALALLVGLSGCHGAKETTPFQAPEHFDSSRNYTITFWAKNDTNLTQVNIYKQAIADFEKLYPNITVELRLYTDYGKIYNDVITNIATDTTPNLCITYPDHIATYLTGEDTVVPLNDLFTHPEYGLGSENLKFDAPKQDELIEKFINECFFSGYYYAIPFVRSTEACYVNKTFVEKLGYTLPETLTWDFVWEVSEAATKKDAQGNYLVNGQKVMIPFIYKSTDNMMIQLLAQRNAGYSTAAGEVQIFNDTTRELLLNIRDHVETRAFDTFKHTGYPANYLNKGQCIFAIDSTAGATWMGSGAPLVDIPPEEAVEFEMEVMTIPQYDPENPKMISQGPSLCLFNKEDPQEVVATWLFAQYLLSNAVQIPYAQTEGYVPVTSKAQQSPEYQDYLSRAGEDDPLYYQGKLDATRLLLDNTENSFVTPVFNGSASLRNAAGQLIEEVNTGVRRKHTVDDEYITKLFDDMTALYRLDQIAVDGSKKILLGELPTASGILLSCLAIAWVGIGGYALINAIRRKNSKKY